MTSKKARWGLVVVCVCLLLLVCLLGERRSRVVVRVDVGRPGAAISPSMWGVFFEDMNFAADGGLYPELLKNRSFEFQDGLMGWKALLMYDGNGLDGPRGELHVATDKPMNAMNPHYLRVYVDKPGYSFYNSGFRGIGVESGKEYRFSAYVRGNGATRLRATLTDEKGKVLGSGMLSGFGDQWMPYQTVIRVNATEQQARLVLAVDRAGDLDLDMVSLFPTDTWKHRENGLRKDLVQMLYDMHPGFLRFPGGCIVEGRELANRYRWKSTLGDISQRKTLINRWNDEFDYRPAPDYYQSFGLGFYEYFQLAEDIGAQPLPVLNCGMACQYDSSETEAMEHLDAYVRDAVDLIEFANGPVDSPWGKVRAQMGHAAPFHMTMLGVGNEQWGPKYVERYKVFAEALKRTHPEIRLIVSVGSQPAGEPFNSMWTAWRQLHPDIVDEHYYGGIEWFLQHTDRYDNYDRSGPKVMAGEFAAMTVATASPENRNTWGGAMSEAAFMTGLERNGDVVQMASYAPLMAHVDAWQWKPDAIWFDNLRSYGTPNYYVQSVFANNAGTRVLPVMPHLDKGLYVSSTLDERTHEVVLKMVNDSWWPRATEIHLDGMQPAGEARVIRLQSWRRRTENTFAEPTAIAPAVSTIKVTSSTVKVLLLPRSLNVYRFGMR